MKLAVTGGTGFVGGHLVDAALAAGHSVRALTRSPRPDCDGIEWIEGRLEDRESVRELVETSDAVIHVAGVINAPGREEFAKANVTGTLAVLAASTAAGVRRFVHVSSLAAREPLLSLYGASKAKSEELVQRSGLDWAIVRPPAVYGPGDRETLELFRMAKAGIVLLPPEGRFSLVHAKDLAGLLLALADPSAPTELLVDPDDGRPGGWSHREFAKTLGKAVGKGNIALSAPAPLLRLGATVDRLIRGDKAKLTPDRAAYFSHPDWVADPSRKAPADLWAPEIETAQGLADTAAWYRRKGWL